MCFLTVGQTIGPPYETNQGSVSEGSLCAHPLSTFLVCSPTQRVPRQYGIVRGWECWERDATAGSHSVATAATLQCQSWPSLSSEQFWPFRCSAMHFEGGWPLQSVSQTPLPLGLLLRLVFLPWSSHCYCQATSNLIMYKMEFCSLFPWLLTGGKWV